MRDRYIPALITLIAGAITCIFDIFRKADLLPSLIRLLVVIIIFYFLGLIARAIIRKVLEPKPKPDEEEEIEEVEEEAADNYEEDAQNKPNVNP